MFKTEDNKTIGSYISGLIDAKYKSTRQFCIDYMKVNNEEETGNTLQNKANRIAQIKNGNKGIQIEDLPIFAELLGVSVEQILSGGKYSEAKAKEDRLTNYSVAQSHNEKIWTDYIERKDTPFLNPDEFGKTILEYAIEFQNYDFLKFLMERNYIWFDSRNDKDYAFTFGAGTKIHRKKYEESGNLIFVRDPQMNDLQYKLATEDQLRVYMISFAVDNNDMEMLKKLRAREVPQLYVQAHYLSCSHPDFDKGYNSKAVSHISTAGSKVLDYFTNSFEIRDNMKYKDGKRKHTFIYPYISQLLDMMITNNNPYLKTALNKMIAYNNSVYKKLTDLIKQSVENGCYYGGDWKNEFDFYKNGNIVSFCDTLAVTGIITNIAHVTRKSKNDEINELIEQLNKSYDRIKNLKTEGLK